MATSFSNNTSRALGTGCLMIFALPFAAVGVGMAIWLFSSLSKCHDAQSWTQTPATILEANLKTSRGSKGGTTYKTEARYAYEINGQKYESDRVSFFSGSDNIGSFHKDAYNELRKHLPRSSSAPATLELDPRTQPAAPAFRCFVNPRNPSEAVLYRDLRLPMIAFQGIFALVFGGVGFGIFAGGIVGAKKMRAHKKLQEQFPAEPWKWKPDWITGRIQTDTKSAVFLTIFALVWNAIAIPAAYFGITQAMKTGQHAAYLILIFPFIGALIAWGAIHQILLVKKFGKTIFQMGSVPGVIGGKLAGLIVLPLKVHAQDGFHLTLTCTRSVTTGSGKQRRTEQIVLWKDEQHIRSDAARSAFETAIPVLFPIPYGQPPSDPATFQPINWQLTVTAENPGIDLKARFDIPVFQTPDSNPDYIHDDSPIRPFLGAR